MKAICFFLLLTALMLEAAPGRDHSKGISSTFLINSESRLHSRLGDLHELKHDQRKFFPKRLIKCRSDRDTVAQGNIVQQCYMFLSHLSGVPDVQGISSQYTTCQDIK